jgi:uncharacterized protein (TIGR04222 family)
MPDPNSLDPYAVSYLRAQGLSERAVVETALFSLWQKKLINVVQSPDNSSNDTISRTGTNAGRLHPIEKAVYDAIAAPQAASTLMANANLKTIVKSILEGTKLHLQQLNLLQTKEFQDKVRGLQFMLILIFSAFAGVKAYLGIINNRPVTYLVFLFVVFVLILFGSMSNTTNISNLGRKYLDSLEKQFEWTKTSLGEGTAAPGFDPVFSVALFGVGILSGLAMYEVFTHAMPPMMSYGGSSDWGSGGSSCSSSSCSSSSCSSSSCGGGGCGGCGAA